MAVSRKSVSDKYRDEARVVPLIDDAELRGRLCQPEDIPVLSELLLDAFGDARFANAVIIAIGGFVTWLMTKPRINAFLTKLGLGAQPKRAAVVVEG